MSDLISRADAIEALRKKLQDWGGYAFEDYRRGLYEAQDILEALPSAEAVQEGSEMVEISLEQYKDMAERLAELEWKLGEAEQRWIPCSERLPDVGENVLFTTDIYGGYVAEGDRRADGKWWQYRWNSLLQNEDVVAWMPLPKPYKGGDDE